MSSFANRKSKIETKHALQQTRKAIEERNEYVDAFKELQCVCEAALDRRDFWKGLVGEYRKICEELNDSDSGIHLSHPRDLHIGSDTDELA